MDDINDYEDYRHQELLLQQELEEAQHNKLEETHETRTNARDSSEERSLP
jgi:hypothetical protein